MTFILFLHLRFFFKVIRHPLQYIWSTKQTSKLLTHLQCDCLLETLMGFKIQPSSAYIGPGYRGNSLSRNAQTSLSLATSSSSSIEIPKRSQARWEKTSPTSPWFAPVSSPASSCSHATNIFPLKYPGPSIQTYLLGLPLIVQAPYPLKCWAQALSSFPQLVFVTSFGHNPKLMIRDESLGVDWLVNQKSQEKGLNNDWCCSDVFVRLSVLSTPYTWTRQISDLGSISFPILFLVISPQFVHLFLPNYQPALLYHTMKMQAKKASPKTHEEAKLLLILHFAGQQNTFGRKSYLWT